jgi:tRNA(fMet)-specific endonuclease VapC
MAYADAVAANNPILVSDATTARIYGSVKNALRIKGQPIPENDMWIAALAIQHDLTLLTRDAHFDRIENARIEQW